jgi:hypothetical protein
LEAFFRFPTQQEYPMNMKKLTTLLLTATLGLASGAAGGRHRRPVQ